MVSCADSDEIVVCLVDTKVAHEPYLSFSAEISVMIIKRLGPWRVLPVRCRRVTKEFLSFVMSNV